MIPFLLRNWQAVVGGVVALALIIMLSIRTSERNDARNDLKASQEENASLLANIAIQNAAVTAWQLAGQAAQERASAALLEAQRANQRQAPVIERLRESSRRAPVDGEPCTISGELRNAQGL